MVNKYKSQYLNPKWQKKRLEILARDEFTCQNCGDKKKTLHVHHHYYVKGRRVWEYYNEAFVTLCEDCHKVAHSTFPLVRNNRYAYICSIYAKMDDEYQHDYMHVLRNIVMMFDHSEDEANIEAFERAIFESIPYEDYLNYSYDMVSLEMRNPYKMISPSEYCKQKKEATNEA